MAVADRFDRVKPSPATLASRLAAVGVAPSPAVKPKPVQTTLIPSYLETAGRAGGANVAPKPAPKPKPVTTTLIPDRLETIGRAGGAQGGVTSGKFVSPADTGEVNRFRNIAAAIGTTPTGSVVSSPVTTAPVTTAPVTTAPVDGGGDTAGGEDGTTAPGGTTEDGATQRPTEPQVDAQAMLAALINQLLEGDFIGFQGQRAAELRRLQNLRNQLYGDAEMGSLGSIERQRQLDANARRRLAASRAVSGMLAGGAYAGTQRGLGTIQRAEQDFGIQEMERPFREQVAADRLREFGLEYTPAGRIFNLSDFGAPTDMLTGWTQQTFGGREAAARARQAAIQQLAQRGIQI